MASEPSGAAPTRDRLCGGGSVVGRLFSRGSVFRGAQGVAQVTSDVHPVATISEDATLVSGSAKDGDIGRGVHVRESRRLRGHDSRGVGWRFWFLFLAVFCGEVASGAGWDRLQHPFAIEFGQGVSHETKESGGSLGAGTSDVSAIDSLDGAAHDGVLGAEADAQRGPQRPRRVVRRSARGRPSKRRNDRTRRGRSCEASLYEGLSEAASGEASGSSVGTRVTTERVDVAFDADACDGCGDESDTKSQQVSEARQGLCAGTCCRGSPFGPTRLNTAGLAGEDAPERMVGASERPPRAAAGRCRCLRNVGGQWLRCVRPATRFGGKYCSSCYPFLCECDCAGCVDHDYTTDSADRWGVLSATTGDSTSDGDREDSTVDSRPNPETRGVLSSGVKGKPLGDLGEHPPLTLRENQSGQLSESAPRSRTGDEINAIGEAQRFQHAEAVQKIQDTWRARQAAPTLSGIEACWTGVRAKRLGKIDGHVRFLQWVFRSTTALRGGCWVRGRLRSAMLVTLTFGRAAVETRCGGGLNLAAAHEFERQKVLSDEMLDWYGTYVTILRRLQSGITPFAVQNFVGGGGSTEGCRRAGGASHGVDLYPQEDYVRRFGAETFTLADGLSWSSIRSVQTRHGASFMIGGPPCKFYSRARVKGEATQPPLISGFRDMCRALFGRDGRWAIENVMGAAAHMSDDATVLDGAYFGLRVARARLYETNFKLHIDKCVRESADRLAARCCLGRRRRFRRFDEFGRPVLTPCCDGNIFAVQGTTAWRCTAAECSEAMGVDPGHMSYERLAQSVPPAFGQLVFAQMCMSFAHERFGVPAITFDDMRSAPSRARRTLAFWLRGAGAADPAAGQLFAPSPSLAAEPGRSARAENHREDGCEEEAEFRELFYSHAGGFDRQWVLPQYAGRLARVCNGVTLASEPSEWAGSNTYVEVRARDCLRLAVAAAEAARTHGPGTRATFVVDLVWQQEMQDLGFRHLPCCVGGKGPDALSYKGKVALHVGRRAGVGRGARLVHDAVRPEMDWRDQGGHETDAAQKATLTWQDFPHDPERYRGKGLPAWVESMMTEGAVVKDVGRVVAEDVEQYSWPSGEALVEAILETDRHLAIGALEFVPDDEVETVLSTCVVHPILLVAQGKGKYRACHDYSRGTNRTSRSAPFILPSVWGARDVIKPGSYLVKYDLRDGFFAVPVHRESRNRLVVRHPATGRLLRCARLPFGYVDSPRLFCGLTEAIADEVRRRVVGRGVNVFVFVDDFLIVGDDREAALLGGKVLEDVLHEFGIPWAPHKQRGPARCMEFLGLLLSNVPGHRCVALTEKRQRKLRDQIDEWMSRDPSRVGIGAGSIGYTADARELASFLGHLVFCSQVIPQGRTYMQAMLSQFAGLEVDWRRGEVRPTRGGDWHQGVLLGPGFWRDLEWWDTRLENRNCTPIDKPPRGEIAVCGTDASDWGTGQLMWESGQRSETVLRFTLAERGRSINWRELLGIVRVLEQFGPELKGRSLLVEGDNTASLAAAEKETSKAEDSQELVRRLVELCERHELHVRFTHTPGVKLIRPDQTSRGDPIEEVRVRVRREAFAKLSVRFGPFTEWVGAERRYAIGGGSPESGTRIWMHPSHSTVGSALRRLGERLADLDGSAASGLVVVPHEPSAKWWPLVKHFAVVGRWAAGSRHLEAYQMGEWREIPSRRSSLILAFPRRVGDGVRSVVLLPGASVSDGYTETEDGRAMLPLPKGSFVYSPSGEKGKRGELLMVWTPFAPPAARSSGVPPDRTRDPHCESCGGTGVFPDGRDEECWNCDVSDDLHDVMAAEMRLKPGRKGADHYTLDVRGPPSGSFSSKGQAPWAMQAELLYDVTAMVDYVSRPIDAQWDEGRISRMAANQLVVAFDFRAAMREIALLNPGALDGPGPLGGALQTVGTEESPEAALALARVSAAEAVAARVRVDAISKAVAPAQLPVVAPTATLSAPLRCKYSEMMCEGCKGLIGWGKLMVAGGRGMCHVDGDCKSKADAKLAALIEGKKKSGEVTEFSGSLKRQAQAAHRLGPERVAMALACLQGRCGVHGEAKLMCIMACGRGVHGYSCAMFSSGVIQLGNLKCAYCRAQDLVESSCTPTDKMVVRTTESMLAEATSGKANTHKGYTDLAMLERKWRESMADDELTARNVKLPHLSAEGTYSFCLWLSREGGRARSMGTTLRQLSSLCSKLELENFANSKRVKALLKDLETKGAAVTTPDTQVTTLMILETYGQNGTLREVCESGGEVVDLTHGREEILNDFELFGGMRVAEVCGGGDGHGLLANQVCIQRVPTGPGSEFPETIEARIEDSKTGFARWTVFQGKSNTSCISSADHLRRWWQLSGVHVVKDNVGAFYEERPDYWVVRVSLLGMADSTFKGFLTAVEWSRCIPIIREIKAILKYAKMRRKGKTLGDDMKYVNVTGGRRTSQEVLAAVSWLKLQGFGAYVAVVPGPLIRATLGHSLTHMPYSPNSTHIHLVPAMKRAFDRVQKSGVADPEYDRVTDPTPIFANHSNRRHADRVAMREADTTKVTATDIDFFFGWELKKMSETMRLYYAGLDRVLRLRLSRVTSMM